MKGTITQYVTLGVMLLLLVLLVSMLPEQKGPKLSGKLNTQLSVLKLSSPNHVKPVSAD